MKKMLSDCCTGKDNKTYDPIKILMIIGMLVYFFLAIYYVIATDHEVDLIAYASGLAIILFGGAGALYAKRSTEPSSFEEIEQIVKKLKNIDDESK